MSHFDNKIPPKREDRLKACIAHSDSICGLAKKGKNCLTDDGERGFTQGSICLLLPALAMLNSLPDNVVLLHSALGCGSCTHSQNANVRMGSNVRWGKVKDGIWLSTALDETDVISGGESKLEQAIIEADRRYRPATIAIVYARHGRELMGCKSPVFESSTVVRRCKSTSRRQGRLREEGSGGSPSAKL